MPINPSIERSTMARSTDDNDPGVSDEAVVKLRNWFRDGEGILFGEAYDHPRLSDGKPVYTTVIQYQYRCQEALYARTQSALYELLADDGQPWFAARNAAPYKHPSEYLKPVVDRGE